MQTVRNHVILTVEEIVKILADHYSFDTSSFTRIRFQGVSGGDYKDIVRLIVSWDTETQDDR